MKALRNLIHQTVSKMEIVAQELILTRHLLNNHLSPK